MRIVANMCQTCGGATYVIDSRVVEAHVRRRRKCRVCGARHTTNEVNNGTGALSLDNALDRLRTLDKDLYELKDRLSKIIRAIDGEL